MRKIKELEARIDKLERLERCNMEIKMKNDDLFSEELDNIKAKQKEQEEFLKNTVAPFIANSLAKELDKGLTTVIDALTDLFAEKPKKKENKKTDTKKTSKTKTKKESK